MNNKSQRLYGLDMLRCILMLIEPIIHTGQLFIADLTLLPMVDKTIEKLTFFTHPFRMDLFFFISGYFTSLVLESKGIAKFRTTRVAGLYIPTVFAFLIILPITNILVVEFSNDKTFHFHHLWFLVVLGVMSLFPYASPNLYAKLTNTLSQQKNYKLLILFAICYIIAWGVRLSFFKWSAFKHEINKEVLALLFFHPLKYCLPFVAGSIVYKKALNLTVTKIQLLLMTILYLITYWITTALPNGGDLYSKGLGLFYQVILTAVAILLSIYLFFFFMNLRLKPTKLLAFVTKSALTFYLVHQLFVFIFGLLIKDRIEDKYYTFFIICILTYIFSFAAYYFFSKNSTLRMLLGIRGLSVATKSK